MDGTKSAERREIIANEPPQVKLLVIFHSALNGERAHLSKCVYIFTQGSIGSKSINFAAVLRFFAPPVPIGRNPPLRNSEI
jgi:hypothetical protein